MKFLIVDDHDLFRSGLRLLLETQYPDASVIEASDFQTGQAILSQEDVALVLTDLTMPDMRGEQGVQTLIKTRSDAKVLVVSARENADEIDRLLAMGISGYIPKSANSEVTLGAIGLALSGGIYLPSLLLTEARSYDEPDIGSYDDALDQLPLTPRQKEIAFLLAKGTSNAIIAHETGISEGTVRIHVSAILRALGVNNRTQVAAIIAEHRYARK